MGKEKVAPVDLHERLKAAENRLLNLEYELRVTKLQLVTAEEKRLKADAMYSGLESIIRAGFKSDVSIYRGEQEPVEMLVTRFFVEHAELRGRLKNLMDENENLTDLLRTSIVGYPKPENVRETNANLMHEPSRSRRNF